MQKVRNSYFVAQSKNSYPAQDNAGIVFVQSKNPDKIRTILYGDRLLNIPFYFALFFNRSSSRISLSGIKNI